MDISPLVAIECGKSAIARVFVCLGKVRYQVISFTPKVKGKGKNFPERVISKG